MAKIKHTKTELKAQKEALTRFERFLPMLVLKKQQLQAEIQSIDAVLEEKTREHDAQWASLQSWVGLFSEDIDLDGLVTLEEIKSDQGNIAGVAIPVFVDISVSRRKFDLFDSPTWVDDAQNAIQGLLRSRAEREILEEQRRLIAEELRTTFQRVNLFEKVKIPECRENIRVIKIFLGDEQTAAVARGKLAKTRTLAYEYED